MSFVLYNAPQSTCSQKVRICLWEKGLPFTEKKLDLFKGDQLTAEYKQLNPNGVVPTLLHDDEIIIDSSVIIEYLDELFPEVPLSPATPIGRAHMREWLRFFEEVAAPAVRVPSYNRVFLRHFQAMTDEEFIAFGESKPLRKDFFLKMGRKGYSDDEMRQAESRLAMTIERMERRLDDGRPWLLGEYSLADICIIPVIIRLNDISMSHLWSAQRHVGAWFARFQEREALQKSFYFGSLLSEQYGDIEVNKPVS
ncbi:MAG: glutathione S-transferase family protein [Gammaproteobacteria bacterium]|nr:glutathione S-transferase family protein [Gammaproteobacteria bacterium]MDH3428787.1 glutathione S-transferase family protein [Gammaproteobacteria bacterium]MDH3432622.1 glutathione S-transferase family protein [Gammaproteobacteria bacterium]